jgi:hypothetical protein
VREVKLKNFKIDKDLCEDYELLCRDILHSDFTAEIVRYIAEEVEAQREEINRVKKLLKR